MGVAYRHVIWPGMKWKYATHPTFQTIRNIVAAVLRKFATASITDRKNSETANIKQGSVDHLKFLQYALPCSGNNTFKNSWTAS